MTNSGSFNFTQIEGTKWRVTRTKGGSFNALTDSYDEAVRMFMRWMWGGTRRPDRLSFEDWKQKNHFQFFLS